MHILIDKDLQTSTMYSFFKGKGEGGVNIDKEDDIPHQPTTILLILCILYSAVHGDWY